MSVATTEGAAPGTGAAVTGAGTGDAAAPVEAAITEGVVGGASTADGAGDAADGAASGDVAAPPPEKKKVLQLTEEQLGERLKRGIRQHLKALGVEDEATLRKKIAAADKAEADKEAARKARLDEVARLKEESAAAAKARDEYKTKYEQAVESAEVERTNRDVTAVAARFVSPKYARFAMAEFAEHVNGLSDDEAAAIDEAAMGAWFADYAKERPEIAAGGEKKGPLTTTTSPPVARVPPAGTNGAKTFAPGKPNSYTDAEVREIKRQNGWNF